MDSQDLYNLYEEIYQIFLDIFHNIMDFDSQEYDNVFKNRNLIEMKTDNELLFEYSIKSFNEHNYRIKDINLNLHKEECPNNIMTEYEEKFSKQNNVIYYVKVEK